MKKFVFTTISCFLLLFSFKHASATTYTEAYVSYGSCTSHISANRNVMVQNFTATSDSITGFVFSRPGASPSATAKVMLCLGSISSFSEALSATSTCQRVASDFSCSNSSCSEYTSPYSYNLNIGSDYYFVFDTSAMGSFNLCTNGSYSPLFLAENFDGTGTLSTNYDIVFSTFYDDTVTFADDVVNYIDFVYPQNGYTVSSSLFNDWVIEFEISDLLNYTYYYSTIFYVGSDLVVYYDSDNVIPSLGVTEWTIEKTNVLEDGNVSAYANLYGSYNNSDWYLLAESPSIYFEHTATSTNTLFDNPYIATPGFTPSTTTLANLFGTSSASEYGIFNTLLSPALSALSYVFPFNIVSSVYEQWEISEEVSLPSSFSFITDMIDSNGDIYWDLDSALFGASQSVVVFGPSLFVSDSSTATFFGNVRSLSTYLLWIIFVLSVGYRGKHFYEDELSQ